VYLLLTTTISTVLAVEVFAPASLQIIENCQYFLSFKDYYIPLKKCIEKLLNAVTFMQSDWKNINFQNNYGYFSLDLHGVPDCSAIFLTVLAGWTVKNSLSPKGSGFEYRWPQQICHWSIGMPSSSHCVHLYHEEEVSNFLIFLSTHMCEGG